MLALVLVLTLALPAGKVLGGPDTRAPRATAAGPPKADRDGDRIFERLEQRLAGRPDGHRVAAIVRLRDPATRERVGRLQSRVGRFSVAHRYRVIDGFAATLTKGQVRALARRGAEVAHVEEDSRVSARNDSAQSSFGVAQARNQDPDLDGDGGDGPATYSPSDLVAAVIDSGIDARHADLDEGKVIAFRDFLGGGTVPSDDDGHGTHVAATIAGDGDGTPDGRYRGVAPAAALVGAKVLDGAGNGSMSDVTAAIDWVVANRHTYGIEAINLSLGVDACSDGTDATSQAVNAAADAGLVVAVAATNAGPGTCTIGSPDAAANALTVGAMADLGGNGFHLAYFSGRGPTLDGRIKPDVVAPGVGVTSAQANTAAGYVAHDGTSMATPFVTGLALLMRDADAGLTPSQVKGAVKATAVDWGRGGDNRTAGSTGPDIDYGAGRLDAWAALRSAGAALSTPPAVPRHHFHEGTLATRGDRRDVTVDVRETQFPIAATMIMPGVTAGSTREPDFDLYLLDPNGVQVAASEFSTRQEEVTFRPTMPGTYTLSVRSYRGSGAYILDVSAGTADTAPPAAPIGLAAVAGDGEVALDWADNGEGDLEGYDVYRATASGGPYTKLNEVRVTASQYTDATAANGSTYFYVVRAVDTAGNHSAPSQEASAQPAASGYRDTVMGTAGLVSYWRLNETSGETAADQHARNPGSYLGGPALGQPGAPTGDGDTAVRFDGVDDVVSVPHSASLTLQSVSVELWARSDGSVWNDTGWLAAKRHSFLLHPNAGTRRVDWYVNPTGHGWQRISHTPADITAWHHYLATYDHTTGRQVLYVDGREVAARTSPAAPLTASNRPLRIGADDIGLDRHGQGWIDEPAIYDRALTDTTATEHYDAADAGTGAARAMLAAPMARGLAR